MEIRGWAILKRVAAVAVLGVGSICSSSFAGSLAPGFTERPQGSRIVVMPADMELFSLSAGGVPEAKADWTQAAQKHFAAGLAARQTVLGKQVAMFDERDMDEFSQVNALHGAVAQAVNLHYEGPRVYRLPTKNGQLNWSMGDSVTALREKTGADYALFTWVRDSYASAERKAAMVAMAILGIGLVGGSQVGYASLVDLQTGRIVWFNSVRRQKGDLREAGAALETVDALLSDFPEAK